MCNTNTTIEMTDERREQIRALILSKIKLMDVSSLDGEVCLLAEDEWEGYTYDLYDEMIANATPQGDDSWLYFTVEGLKGLIDIGALLYGPKDAESIKERKESVLQEMSAIFDEVMAELEFVKVAQPSAEVQDCFSLPSDIFKIKLTSQVFPLVFAADTERYAMNKKDPYFQGRHLEDEKEVAICDASQDALVMACLETLMNVKNVRELLKIRWEEDGC